MSAQNACPRAGKWIRGCRFEGRYDVAEPRQLTDDELFWLDGNTRVPALRAASATTYVRDVCRTCGRTIERTAPAPASGEGAAA